MIRGWEARSLSGSACRNCGQNRGAGFHQHPFGAIGDFDVRGAKRLNRNRGIGADAVPQLIAGNQRGHLGIVDNGAKCLACERSKSILRRQRFQRLNQFHLFAVGFDDRPNLLRSELVVAAAKLVFMLLGGLVFLAMEKIHHRTCGHPRLMADESQCSRSAYRGSLLSQEGK